MAFKFADSVRETSTTTGTGTLNLAGAVSGYQTFVAGIGSTNTCVFTIEDANGTAWEHSFGTVTDATPDTLSRTLIASSTGSLISLSAGTHTVYCSWIGDRANATHFAAHSITPGGRLTLTSGTPVTTADVTGATSIYYTPFVNDIINLWDGNFWRPIVFTEYTLALGTLTSGKPYDVFAYLSAGALAAEVLVWTSDTARATAITLQDGRYCKSGDKTRLYLGTFYTTATTTTEDSQAKRFLFNWYNQRGRDMYIATGDSSHTYTTTSFRNWNNTTTNTRTQFINGLAGSPIIVECASSMSTSGAGTPRYGVGLNSSSPTTYALGISVVRNDAIVSNFPITGGMTNTITGLNYLQLAEWGDTTATFNYGYVLGFVWQ